MKNNGFHQNFIIELNNAAKEITPEFTRRVL